VRHAAEGMQESDVLSSPYARCQPGARLPPSQAFTELELHIMFKANYAGLPHKMPAWCGAQKSYLYPKTNKM